MAETSVSQANVPQSYVVNQHFFLLFLSLLEVPGNFDSVSVVDTDATQITPAGKVSLFCIANLGQIKAITNAMRIFYFF